MDETKGALIGFEKRKMLQTGSKMGKGEVEISRRKVQLIKG